MDRFILRMNLSILSLFNFNAIFLLINLIFVKMKNFLFNRIFSKLVTLRTIPFIYTNCKDDS